MRGIIPIVAVVLLVAIAVIGGVGVYFWMSGMTTKQPTPEAPSSIIINPITGSNKVLIANLGQRAINTSSLKTSDPNTSIVCESEIIAPGEQVLCTITGNADEDLVVYGKETGSAFLPKGSIYNNSNNNGNNSTTPSVYWAYNDWTYRQKINITELSGNSLIGYQVKLELNSTNVGPHFNWTSDQNSIRFSANKGVYYELPINITEQSGQDLTNYQVKIDITNPDIVQNIGRSDAGDIRFFENEVENPYSETTGKLNYWVEKFGGSELVVWVKIPSIPANGKKTIYMYYGNSSAPPESNGTAVFLFFDNMESWGNWTRYGYGQVNQDSTRAYDGTYSAHKTTANDPNGAYKALPTPLGRDIILEAWCNRNSGYTGGSWDRVGLIDDSGNGYGLGHEPAAGATSNNFLIDVRNSYSATATYFTGTNAGGDVWYKQKLYILSNGTVKAEFYDINDNLLASGSIIDNSYSEFTNFYIFGGYDYWVDLVKIRKYANPEPTVSIGSPTKIETKEAPIPYWIEYWNSTEQKAIVWVKVPEIPANGNATIYMYYGNPAASSESNGSLVFDFFDDFETWEGWSNWGSGSVSQANSHIYHGSYSLKKDTYCHPNGGYKSMGITLDRNNWIIEFLRYRVSGEGTDCYADRTGVGDSNGNGYNVGWSHGSSPKIYVDKMSGTSTTVLGQLYAGPDILNEWYIAQLILTPSEVGAVVKKLDGAVLGSTSVADTTYGTFTHVFIEGGRPYYVDAIRVRKYASPEPSVSLGEEETRT